MRTFVRPEGIRERLTRALLPLTTLSEQMVVGREAALNNDPGLIAALDEGMALYDRAPLSAQTDEQLGWLSSQILALYNAAVRVDHGGD